MTRPGEDHSQARAHSLALSTGTGGALDRIGDPVVLTGGGQVELGVLPPLLLERAAVEERLVEVLCRQLALLVGQLSFRPDPSAQRRLHATPAVYCIRPMTDESPPGVEPLQGLATR